MGHHAVVNLASAIPPTLKFMQTKVWADLTASAPRAQPRSSMQIAAGASRVVQESVSMLYRDRGDVWIDEDWPTDNFPMAHAIHAAEGNANRFSAAGGVGVVLRFGWFYGPGATHREEFLALARRHVCVMMGLPNTYVSSGALGSTAGNNIASGNQSLVFCCAAVGSLALCAVRKCRMRREIRSDFLNEPAPLMPSACAS
jgi:hypothetical protein